MVQYWCVPVMGMVSMGTGTVSENLTHSISVANPTHDTTVQVVV